MFASHRYNYVCDYFSFRRHYPRVNTAATENDASLALPGLRAIGIGNMSLSEKHRLLTYFVPPQLATGGALQVKYPGEVH